MQQYEYKVIPAPVRGEKARGVKTAPERFAHALANLMNRLGQEGWDFLRSETLPAEEREGLMRRTTVYHNVLVFRRTLDTAAPATATDEPAVLGEPPTSRAPAAPPRAVVTAGAAPGIAATGGAPGSSPKLGPAKPGTGDRTVAG